MEDARIIHMGEDQEEEWWTGWDGGETWRRERNGMVGYSG